MSPRRTSSWLALLPMAMVVVVAYAGGLLWTARISLSSSRTLPVYDYVGLAQYARLFADERWLMSLQHGAVFTVSFVIVTMIVGVLLAIAVDRGLRGEVLLRGIFLYPYALSFVASGLVWQWMLNPELGVQQTFRNWGLASFRLDWIVDQHMVIYAIVVAMVWQSAGIVMALVLAGLRGVDSAIWHAARIDGVPTWRTYASIVIPSLGPALSTAFILLLTVAVKLFDPVVAMTQGGPGLASEVPAKFIMDYLFGRANVGLASAAAISLTLTALLVLAPFFWARRYTSVARQRL